MCKWSAVLGLVGGTAAQAQVRVAPPTVQRAREIFGLVRGATALSPCSFPPPPLQACIERVTTWEGFMAALDNKHMALAPWADEEDVEEDVKKRSVTPDAMGAKVWGVGFRVYMRPPP